MGVSVSLPCDAHDFRHAELTCLWYSTGLLEQVTAVKMITGGDESRFWSSGYLLFDQIRWRSQVQLQGMQAVAFLMVAMGNYLDTGSWTSFLVQMLVMLPCTGALTATPAVCRMIAEQCCSGTVARR